MNFIGLLGFKGVSLSGILVLGALCVGGSSAAGETWSRTLLGQGGWLIDGNGSPVLDVYGDPRPLLPGHYKPSAVVTSEGLNVLRYSVENHVPPYELDPNGFPILGDYFRFDSLLFSDGAWTEGEPFTDWIEDVVRPSYVSCMDDSLLVSYWDGLYLCIDTLDETSPTRLTLPIPAMKGTVAVDANGGIHVLSIDDDYKLWHRYYSDETLISVKLSDGPVCDVVVAAGEGDSCHVAYTTFSEDLNLNEALDDGEDVNGNSLLDVVPHQLAYQLINGNVPEPVETLIADSLIRVCYFDLLFSPTYGLSLVYADPVMNAIRLAERELSTWSVRQVSSAVALYGPLAFAMKSNGDRVVSSANQNGLSLRLLEETSGIWAESIVQETTIGGHYIGTDVVVSAADEIVVLAAEKSRDLVAYTVNALPTPIVTYEAVDIRNAFIVTWPTAGEGVVRQILQATSDLSDPDSWEEVERKNWYDFTNGKIHETVVEQEAQQFYRVLEFSE